MNLQSQISSDLKTLSPDLMAKLYQFLSSLKKRPHSNSHPFLKFAGTISDVEASKMKSQIDEEFNSIEGEW